MNDLFLESIHIKNIRHLNDMTISLSGESKKHLIITGKNGSGKTSLLEGIMNHVRIFDKSSAKILRDARGNIAVHEAMIQQLLESSQQFEEQELKRKISEQQKYIENNKERIEEFNKEVSLEFNEFEEVDELYKDGRYIIAYFNASRVSQMTVPTGIESINLNDKFSIDDNIGNLFVKYLVDLKGKQMFADYEGHEKVAKDIKLWFDFLEKNLRVIFENDDLNLVFDYMAYNFYLEEPNKEKYTLNTLSSGFSSILKILTEIIMRMEKNKNEFYDVQGLVIIDEIDAHLHISLQKKVFKFLADFFPNIQFIVTTHSPFVINSVENVIVYDLEKKILLEDLSSFSYKAILEGYFEIDPYSDIVKQNLDAYKKLSQLPSSILTTEQKVLFDVLKKKIQATPDLLSEELKLEATFTDIKRLLRED